MLKKRKEVTGDVVPDSVIVPFFLMKKLTSPVTVQKKTLIRDFNERTRCMEILELLSFGNGVTMKCKTHHRQSYIGSYEIEKDENLTEQKRPRFSLCEQWTGTMRVLSLMKTTW